MHDNQEIGRFGFGIRLFLDGDKLVWRTDSVNQGVPPEVVVMQMKKFVQKLEKDFYEEKI